MIELRLSHKQCQSLLRLLRFYEDTHGGVEANLFHYDDGSSITWDNKLTKTEVIIKLPGETEE
jgi:hypothetical protein